MTNNKLENQNDLFYLLNNNSVIQDETFQNISNYGHTVRSENLVFKNVKFINVVLKNVGFDNCIFENCLFKDSSINEGFDHCEFKDCLFDGLSASHNNAISNCKFHNLKTTKNQGALFNVCEATFYNTDLSGQENFIQKDKNVRFEQYHFVNSKIDIKTIRRMATMCEEFWYRGESSSRWCHAKSGKGIIFPEPWTTFYAQNASQEVKMNFIMAMLTHEIRFEIDDTDESSVMYPIRVISSLKNDHICIIDDNGNEIDLNKIFPFDFDLQNAGDRAYCDLSIYNERIGQNQWSKEKGREQL